MYDRLWGLYYCPVIAAEVANKVRNSDQCDHNLVLIKRKTNPINQYPDTRPLEFVALGILGTLTKTTTGFKYVLLIVY